MLPFFLFAMYEKHGQPLEKILGQHHPRVCDPAPKNARTVLITSMPYWSGQANLDEEVSHIVYGNQTLAAPAVRKKTRNKLCSRSKQRKSLSRADKKQIEAAIARANRTDKKEKSAQDSIPYERMWPDGICRVADGHYTKKPIQFQDINYQLSQNEDKTAIFEGWCDFLNYFDSSISL